MTCTVARSDGPEPAPAAGSTVTPEIACGAKGAGPHCWRTAHAAETSKKHKQWVEQKT